MLLYDLVADPSETTNIAALNPAVIDELKAILVEFNSTAASSAQQGIANDPRADPKLFNGTCSPWLSADDVGASARDGLS